tara:strand:+ start:2058 stop:3377 length:1320 start_codon:yes stop_codon:yes gene_type:complete
MQTPGRQNEPQTPMLPIIERRVEAIESSSILNFQRVESIERGQRRVFGRVINQLGVLSKNMNDMRNIIRRDIRDKQKYFKEEQKILKKDSDNLSGINAALFLTSRRGLAAALGLLGLSQLSEGNTRVGLENIGGAAALLTPEILEIITGTVINALALKGLVGGGKGAGAIGLLKNIGGKKGLFLIASLAAALILPQLANNQNADKRRSEIASRTIGKQLLNEPDVTRFRQILNRFDKILSSIKLSNQKRQKSTFDDKLLERKGDNDGIKKGEQLGREIGKEIQTNFNLNLQKNDSEQTIDNIDGGGDEENNDKISMNVDNTDTDNSFNPTLFGGTFSASTNLFVDQNIDNSDKRVDRSKIVFNSPLQSLLDINLSVPSKEDTKKKINFINLSEENKSDTSDPLFVGESVSPNYINVGTKFASIDLFDNASSYKTYGVFL